MTTTLSPPSRLKKFGLTAKPRAKSSVGRATSFGTRQAGGLDIGASAVRAVEIEHAEAAPTLVAFGQIGVPPGTIVDGEVRDVTALTDAIKRLWQNGRFS
ncbi:MAG: pilus assembly protein PilM, partial [Acidimicrobiales bacterium]